MTYYRDDRSFTNYVHDELAIPQIYKRMGWLLKDVNKDELELLDINHGIDYIAFDQNNKSIKIQERFRDSFYQNFNDATLRYRREQNSDPSRIKSEFYKIKADYLVYGITNGKKFIDKRHTLTDFIKWVIIDINFLKQIYDSGKLEIISTNRITCKIENEKLICPENYNKDGSSSFVPFDVIYLNRLWGDKVILAQKGFFNKNKMFKCE